MCEATASSLRGWARILLVAAGAATASCAGTQQNPPNILYIMTDDQDIELGGLTPMPKTRRLLGEQGAVGEACGSPLAVP